MRDFVTSLHAIFGRNLAKLRGSVEEAFLNGNANEKHQMTFNDKLYKMAISVFRVFGFLTPKMSFFNGLKSKSFKISTTKKTYDRYAIQLLLVYQRAKFQVDSSILDPKWATLVSEIIPIISLFQMPFFRGSYLKGLTQL